MTDHEKHVAKVRGSLLLARKKWRAYTGQEPTQIGSSIWVGLDDDEGMALYEGDGCTS